MAFAFANAYSEDAQAICTAAAQVAAATFGLDHEHYCPDVMTFLTGCGDKSFTDHEAPCGAFEERDCACGGSTQNSYRKLLELLGPAP